MNGDFEGVVSQSKEWREKGSGENLVELWQIMYDRFTDEFELNNGMILDRLQRGYCLCYDEGEVSRSVIASARKSITPPQAAGHGT